MISSITASENMSIKLYNDDGKIVVLNNLKHGYLCKQIVANNDEGSFATAPEMKEKPDIFYRIPTAHFGKPVLI